MAFVVGEKQKDYGNIADEIHNLWEQRHDVTKQDAEYDKQLVRRVVEKIMVHGGRLTVEYKSGMNIDVE